MVSVTSRENWGSIERAMKRRLSHDSAMVSVRTSRENWGSIERAMKRGLPPRFGDRNYNVLIALNTHA